MLSQFDLAQQYFLAALGVQRFSPLSMYFPCPALITVCFKVITFQTPLGLLVLFKCSTRDCAAHYKDTFAAINQRRGDRIRQILPAIW